MDKKIHLAAINSVITTNIKDNKERINTKGVVTWGSDNDYPDYLLSLTNNVTTLRTAINACVDYTLGDGIETIKEDVNDKMSTETFIELLARDYFTYGGMAYNVIRNNMGEPIELHYLDIRHLRMNEDATEFYYSEDWSKCRAVYITLPAFGNAADPSSVCYYKNIETQVYPAPLYSAAVKACEMEARVNEYHLNAINNAFTGSYLISFNNGTPTDDEQSEIERLVNEKFSGYQNAARILCAFNEDKDHSVELHKLDTEDFSEHYQAAIERARNEILCAFRCTPQIIGIPLANMGFNEQEFSAAFKLFARTVIYPAQKKILRFANKAMPIIKGIMPFSIKFVS